jgi:hypothetical protein
VLATANQYTETDVQLAAKQRTENACASVDETSSTVEDINSASG